MFSHTVVPFREGDVVQEIGEADERRISEIDQWSWFRVVGERGNLHNPNYWRLLRRPVRVGDQILRPSASIPTPLEVSRVLSSGHGCQVVSSIGKGLSTAAFQDCWQHVNGVPVDWIGYKPESQANLNGNVIPAIKLAEAFTEWKGSPVLDTDRLASELCRLLDEPFNRFVAERSEVNNGHDGGLQRTEALAWKRNELGARTRWTDIARRLQNGLKLSR